MAALFLVILLPPPALAATPEVFPVPADIPANCSVDVSARLLKWVASVPDGSVLLFGRNACYRVDGSGPLAPGGALLFFDRHDLTFEGNGSTFKTVTDPAYRSRATWRFYGGSNIVLRDMTVQGPCRSCGNHIGAYQPEREAQHCYALNGVQTAVLDNVQGYGCHGDFVNLNADGGALFRQVPRTLSTNIVVINSHFERSGRHGLGLIGVNGATVINTSFSDIGYDGVDIEPGPNLSVRNVLLQNDTIGPSRLVPFAASGHAGTVTVDHVNFTGVGCGGPRAQVSAPMGFIQQVAFTNNKFPTVCGRRRSGLEFVGVNGVTVDGNSVYFSSQYTPSAVRLTASRNVHIDGNTFLGARVLVLADHYSTWTACGNVTRLGGGGAQTLDQQQAPCQGSHPAPPEGSGGATTVRKV